MKNNIIELLSANIDAGDTMIWLLIALAAWCIFWRLFLLEKLSNCDVNSFWYAVYELGAIGTFGIIIFLLIIAILFIASIQAVIGYGVKLLAPLFLFWGGFITISILFIRSICKKK